VQPHAGLQTQFGDEAVIPGCESHGIAGPLEEEKEPVAAVDFSTRVKRDQAASALVMLCPQHCGPSVAEALDERRAVDHVGQEQGVLAHRAPFSK